MGGLNHLPAKPCIYSQTYPNIVDNDVHSVTIDDNSFPQLDGNVSVCTNESENNTPYLPKTGCMCPKLALYCSIQCSLFISKTFKCD